MDVKYIKPNIFPIIVELFFIIACFLFREYCIYINFWFYMTLFIYLRKDFSFKELADSVKGGKVFWRQVMATLLFFGLAFAFTSILENIFPYLDMGMMNLKVNNWLTFILFTASIIILPPIVEEVFYRKNLISFKNRKILILTTLLSMFLYALEHALAIWGIFLCMIWALPLSVAYIKTKNVYVPITAHFICNVIVNGITIIKLFHFLIKTSSLMHCFAAFTV